MWPRCGGANEDGGERKHPPGNTVETTSLTRSKGLYISIVLGVLLLFGSTDWRFFLGSSFKLKEIMSISSLSVFFRASFSLRL